MTTNQYALVTLGLTENDVSTIKYAAEISRIFALKKIYFLHVASTLEIPKAILEKHPDLIPPLDESLVVEMKRMVSDNFKPGNDNTELDYAVLEGSILSKILHYTTIKNVDLIIIGNSNTLGKTSLIATQLANKAPCSVLSVPYGSRAQIKNILVAIDFSEHSEKALQKALDIQKENGAKIRCLHVYRVPAGYSKAGRSIEEFAKLLRLNAVEEFSMLINNLDCDPADLNCDYVHDRDAAGTTRKIMESGGADTLIMGARGRGIVAKLILGSVTAELLLTAQTPIFAVKEKGENMNVLQAMLTSK